MSRFKRLVSKIVGFFKGDRRLITEWRLGPFVLAFFWPPFQPRRKPAVVARPLPLLMDDEKTPVVDVPIIKVASK